MTGVTVGRWEKHFCDGTSYVGDDSDKSASWRQSKSDGILGVSLTTTTPIENTIEIRGLGEYWQSDDYEADFLVQGGKRTKRRIERKILATDTYYSLVGNRKLTKVVFQETIQDSNIRVVTKSMVGMWLILEICTKTGSVKLYFSHDRL